jgi:hypothetical protein
VLPARILPRGIESAALGLNIEACCDEHAVGDRSLRLNNPKRSPELLAARR